jgi:hypothetical protein
MYADLGLFIDGQWLSGAGRKGEDVVNPATGKTLAHLPHASTADLDAALGAAAKGFATWKATSAYERSKIMRKAADLLRERHDHIAKGWSRNRARSIRKRAPRCLAAPKSSSGMPRKAAAPIRRRLERERFILPKSTSFYDLYDARNEANIGEKINIALEKIEDNNRSKLEGVFRNIDFNSESSLGKTKDRNRRLKNMLRKA